MASPTIPDLIDRLRYHAARHPTIEALVQELPALPTSGPASAGLYADASRVPGRVFPGEVRVSVLRVVSVGPDGPRLLGQVQAMRSVDHPLHTWRLSFYLHLPPRLATLRIEDQEIWFVRLLELHYRQGGVEVPFRHAPAVA